MEMSTEVQRGDTLSSSLSAYSVLEFIGEGCFGKVAKCLNIWTRETVAIKICKETPGGIHATKKEISTLERLSVLDPESSNLVRFIERFDHVGQCCLAFEMLDINLYDLVNCSPPLSASAIRPIAQQLMVALDALKGLGIVHCDIKPDNIMLVSRSQPFRVKLIDFGEAIPITQLPRGPLLQPVGYRAPEVSLGLPLTEAIDMWGVGCVLASLFLEDNLFEVNCDYLMMKQMVITLGQPEDYLLAAGKNTHRYFKQDPWWNLEDPLAWMLLTPREFEAENSRSAFLDDTVPLRSLEHLAHIYPDGDSAEMEDRLAFADFLKDLLHLDGFMRISPATALQHRYLTMRHQVMSPETSDE
ncbi:homeodomain-interacting protein kinase 1-like isoform X1 [Xyrichtys novacula]|uniref:Homeodomain-interacting protein kinase 1-like isoform X1 n=1 Tax=Xyrichtys novacula TaxID=13765 RepID=A0AAV1HFC0_XYRNO|nr:homeodomain-interacting protein kinase 1-like isoform X1 [Xyrichtys novacula]